MFVWSALLKSVGAWISNKDHPNHADACTKCCQREKSIEKEHIWYRISRTAAATHVFNQLICAYCCLVIYLDNWIHKICFCTCSESHTSKLQLSGENVNIKGKICTCKKTSGLKLCLLTDQSNPKTHSAEDVLTVAVSLSITSWRRPVELTWAGDR